MVTAIILACLLLVAICWTNNCQTMQNILIGVFSSMFVAFVISLIQYLYEKQKFIEHVYSVSKKVCVNLFGLRDLLHNIQPNTKAVAELAAKAYLEGSKLDIFQYSPFFERKKMNHIRLDLYSVFNRDLSVFSHKSYKYELEVLRSVVVIDTCDPEPIDEIYVAKKDKEIELMRVSLNTDVNAIINAINDNMQLLDTIQYPKSNEWAKLYEKWIESYASFEAS